MTPASIIPVFGSQRPYADLNFAGGSFGLAGQSVSNLTALPGFTFTRASLAMGYDATGKLTYGPNNLLLQSQTFGTTWTQTGVTVTSDAIAAPDGTLTADKIMEVAAASTPRIVQSTAIQVGAVYIWSIYAKTAERNEIRIVMEGSGSFAAYFDTDTGIATGAGNATMTAVGNGWYRCSIKWTAASTSTSAYVATASGGSTIASGDPTKGIYLWGAQLEAVTYQTTPSTYYPTTTAAYYGPRLVYDPVTLASQGILVEEARTNSILQSNTFDNASWTKAGATITPNSTTSPDGTTNAAKFADAGAGANHFLYQLYTVTNGSTWTHSVYAKKGSFDWFIINPFNSTNYRTWFNLNTGVVGVNAAGNTASITSVGNGWYRCSVTRTMVGTAAYVELELASADGVVATTVGDVFVYGAQAELGTGASSPVPTTTAAVTRAADVAAVTGLSPTFPMSMAWEWRRNWDVGGTQAISTIDAGSAAQRVITYVGSGDNTQVGMDGGANAGFVTDAGTVGVNTTYKHAARMALNNMNMALGGVLATPDTTADYPTSVVSNLRIGTNTGGAAQLNGTISRIRIYNRALPDAQLQSLTT